MFQIKYINSNSTTSLVAIFFLNFIWRNNLFWSIFSLYSVQSLFLSFKYFFFLPYCITQRWYVGCIFFLEMYFTAFPILPCTNLFSKLKGEKKALSLIFFFYYLEKTWTGSLRLETSMWTQAECSASLWVCVVSLGVDMPVSIYNE